MLSEVPKTSQKITIKATSNLNKEVIYEATLYPEKAVQDTFVHKLAARRRIQDMQNVKEIVALATKYSLASDHTSFILVEGK